MTLTSETTAAPGVPADALRKALTSQIRPSRPNPLTAVRVSAWRTMRKMKHYGVAVLFDVTLMPIVFLLTFTYLFGGAFAGFDQGVPAVLPAGRPRADRHHADRLHRYRAQHGHHPGHLRPVPDPAVLAALPPSWAASSVTSSAMCWR